MRKLISLIFYINNGYSRHQCLRAFLKVGKSPKIKKDLKYQFSGVHLSFIQRTTDKISRILKKHKVPSTFRPLKTIQISLRSVKDPMDPNYGKGIYVILWSCGTSYIGETSRLINKRIQEHALNIKHRRSHSSTLAERVEKKKNITSTLKSLGSLQGLIIFITISLGRPWKLKGDLTIWIEMMVWTLAGVGPLPYLLKFLEFTFLFYYYYLIFIFSICLFIIILLPFPLLFFIVWILEIPFIFNCFYLFIVCYVIFIFIFVYIIYPFSYYYFIIYIWPFYLIYFLTFWVISIILYFWLKRINLIF